MRITKCEVCGNDATLYDTDVDEESGTYYRLYVCDQGHRMKVPYKTGRDENDDSDPEPDPSPDGAIEEFREFLDDLGV